MQGLRAGKFQLKIDGYVIANATANEWAAGKTFDDFSDLHQIEKFQQSIIDKNQLYFYRWRPQNVTYLFGFRKHEQGQNAKEVAEFDKLVAAKEKEIAKLRKPVTRTYELIRVKGIAK